MKHFVSPAPIKIAAFILWGTLLASFAFSQTSENKTDQTPDKTFKANARVNPMTLAMEMTIPLPSYPGRAGMAVSNSISYSSKVWGSSPLIHYSTLSGPKTQIDAQYSKGSWSGWTSGMGVPQLDTTVAAYTETGGAWAYDPALDPGSDFNIVYVKRMHIVMPDGSVHEVRADDGYHPYGTAVNPGNGVSDSDFYSGTFLSVGGSKMRLEFHYDSGTSSYISVLYMSDGSRFINLPVWNSSGGGTAVGGTTYFDVNGNTMTYALSSGNAVWTDTMGRSLQDPLPRDGVSALPTATATPTYAYPTMSPLPSPSPTPVPQNVQFTWASLSTQQSTLSYISQVLCSGGTTTAIPGGSPYLFTTPGGSFRVCPGTGGTFDPIVLTAVTLPNGAKYSFHYNVYGEIDRIDYPTGGYERFVYAQAAPISSIGNITYDQFNRIVTDRYVSEDGSTEVRWHYAINKETTVSSNGPYHVMTMPPDGTCTETLFTDIWNSGANYTYGYYSGPLASPIENRSWGSGNTTANTCSTLLRRSLLSYTQTGDLTIDSVTPYSGAYRDTRPDRQVDMTFESGSSNALISMTEHTYDTGGSSDPDYFSSNNESQTKVYNYLVQSASTATSASISTAAGWFSSGDVAVINETDFLYDSNYMARDLTSLPTEARVKDTGGSTKAKTQFSYDESGYVTTTGGSMPSGASGSYLTPTGTTYWYQLGSTIGAKRGLATSVKRYYDISNSYYITTHATYDQYGNAVSATDGRGNSTTATFDSSYAFAYPTGSTTSVPDSGGTHGSSSAFTGSTAYDYNTGLPVSKTDINSQTTTMLYADALLRPTLITAPNGQQTTMEYGTPSSGVYSASQRYVRTRSQIDSTNWKDGYAFFDGLGRTSRTQRVDPAGDDFVMTCYDSVGRVSQATNPFRSYSTQTCSTTVGLDWTTNTYDTLGRITSVTTPDSAHVDTAYSLADSGSQIGTAVTVTDQASKVRRGITNAVGQLIRVDEPTTSGLGTFSSPNQATTYSYSVLNNLTGVTQGSQTRTFNYDDLSRLKDATNPESGTIKYTYDENSNLKTRWDARGLKTIYDYDTLNRVWGRCYKNVGTSSLGNTTCASASGETADSNTPDVSLFYDNVTNAKGKLTKVSSSVSTTEYTSFDTMGRVTGHKQTMVVGSSQDYTTAYTYDLAGDLLEETYPSGRVVKNSVASDGSLSQVQTKPSGGSYTNRASSFVYNEFGGVSSLLLGNGKYETTLYNNRMQPTQIGLGTSTSDQSLLKINYTYGSSTNNGNVLTQTITVPSMTYTQNQTYTYDELNRLATAAETYNGSTTWSQTFGYDRYGNRNITAGTGYTNLTFSASTNKITTSGYTYDSVGNTTADPSGKSYTYDADNKQIQVTNGGTLGNYAYDGDGKRVKKYNTSNSDDRIFLYDAVGKLVEERNLSNAVQTSYVYAGSSLLSTETTANAPQYLTADMLGTPRINTDGSGNVTARHDYMPFGEEIFTALTAQRTTLLGYPGSDGVRKQFTGYERDNEDGLDFAQARYYANSLGRFTSSDPLMSSAQSVQPQSWNRYTYALNNPLRYVDQNGENYEDLTDKQKKLIDDWAARQNAAQKTDLSAQKIYDALGESQRSTFEAAANALENTTIIGKDGTKINGLDTIKSVSFIYGQKPEGNDKEPSFRLYLELKDTMGDFIKTASNFHKVPGHKPDFPDSRQLNGGEPSPQISMSADGKSADVDVDYESKNLFIIGITLCGNHCTEMNSDVRADGHFDAHNKRFGNGPAGPLKRRYEPTLPK